jgi:hypothetical protein
MVQVFSRSTCRASGLAASIEGKAIPWSAWRDGERWVVSVDPIVSAKNPELLGEIMRALLLPAEECTERWKRLFKRSQRRIA